MMHFVAARILMWPSRPLGIGPEFRAVTSTSMVNIQNIRLLNARFECIAKLNLEHRTSNVERPTSKDETKRPSDFDVQC